MCVYVLSAVVVADCDLDGVRNGLKDLLQGKAKALHWRREKPERLPVIAAAIAGMPISAVVAVCLHGESISSERARRFCLWQLLIELVADGVDRVVLESRQAQDRLDYDVIRNWRRFERRHASVRMDFEPAYMEPALWAADCVAGAVAWWLGGEDVGWNELGPLIRIIEVES